MEDFIQKNDGTEKYRSIREGNYHSYQEESTLDEIWAKKYSRHIEDSKKCYLLLYPNKKHLFSKELLAILQKIFKDLPNINVFALILVMRFYVILDGNTVSYNRFFSHALGDLNSYLKKQWKEINLVLQSRGSKRLETLKKNNTDNSTDRFIQEKLFKNNVYADNYMIVKYFKVWKLYIEIFREREKRELIVFHNYIEDKKQKEINEQKKKIVTRLILGSNGRNACYINSVLYVLMSNPGIKFGLIYNRFLTSRESKDIDTLVHQNWDDRLYKMYYDLFKRHDVPDLPTVYGEYGNPHTILIFLIDRVLKNHLIYDISYVFSYNIAALSDFLTFVRNSDNGQALYGIIKSTKKTKVQSMDVILEEEVESHHFCSFVCVAPNQFILFDALFKGGTCLKRLYSNQDVFEYETEADPEPEREAEREAEPEADPEEEDAVKSFQFFFIYTKRK